ncbi:MAG TPA: dCTP deaminase [Acidimicrobiales bacterium]|nr:dCTP deaminase [Acidimicrobiales bacterium]
MILSDRTIREQLAAGRIVIDPLDESCIQPSSVDLHIDRYFRVFRNHTMRVIDVKEHQEELTELVEIGDGDVFILHPGEFVLGSTLERVALPDDHVARLEGKSSLGRLGLLIHSSLPASERVLILDDSGLRQRRIGDVVTKRMEGSVVGFDPDTFEVSYFPITGWYEGPPDRIYEVRLASGRKVRVTAGHNLFSLDRHGDIRKLRAGELSPGTFVAIPREIPDPPDAQAVFDFRDLIPESLLADVAFEGPVVEQALRQGTYDDLMCTAGYGRHLWHYRNNGRMPGHVVRVASELWDQLGPAERIRPRGGRSSLPVVWPVDDGLAWLIGFYVAEGYRRRTQVNFANTDPALLDRVASILEHWDLPVYRSPGHSITSPSMMLSYFMEWIGTGGKAWEKRVPAAVLGWPQPLLESFLQGLLDGDGTHDRERRCYWSSSPDLVADVLVLAPRLGLRASSSFRDRAKHGLFQVSIPRNEHKVLTSVPLPDRLLVALRTQLGLSQTEAAALIGWRNSHLCNVENRTQADAVKVASLRRIAEGYRGVDSELDLSKLDRLVGGHVAWDRVVDVIDTGESEPVFDLEVRPGGRKIENFVAGSGGLFVSNTAGFVDAGWDGHLTLELSNVANLPITLYPGMKIGQISFLQMTGPAEHPYGSTETGSKYKYQRGPTPSRYFENFQPRKDD